MSFFSSSGFVIVNREVARKIGINEAILLYELVRLSEHYKNLNQYQTFDGIDGYFFQTIEHLEKWTVLTREQQDKAFKKLSSLNFVEKILKGLPAKRYFKINETEVIKYLFLDCVKDTNFVVGNTQQYKNKDIKNKDIKKTTTDKPNLGHAYANEDDGRRVVFSKLSVLNLPDSLKEELSQRNDEATLEKAIDRTLKWDNRSSDAAAIQHVLKNFDTWEDKVSPEELENNNRILLKKLNPYDLKEMQNNSRLYVGNDYFEIVNCTSTIYYSVKHKDFEEKVNELLQQLEENNENK